MSLKIAILSLLAALPALSACADEAASAESAPQENPELEGEISFVEALVDAGYPDFAPPVVEAAKKKWPESEARFFAIEVRGLLALGQFEQAEKKIAALPDRKSAKFWAARLEMANSYFVRGKKEECVKIYEEFFNFYQQPPKDIRTFYQNACYAYGQLLVSDKKYEKAVERYEALLKQLQEGSDEWCNIACETVEIYLRLANDKAGAANRATHLKAAGKIADALLWQIEKPVYFGRAVSMKAHIEQMKGDIERATAIIDEYKGQLQEIHDQIVQFDPEGKEGLLKQSPLPECLYLQAKMLWETAQEEAEKKPKRDDERIKSLLFGPKAKGGGKRNGAKGAYNMAVNVFLNYETSAWAPAAGDLSEEIKGFAEKEYKAKIVTRITKEQIEKVRAAQFREANEKFLSQQYQEAIDAYLAVLARYPEFKESVMAVENVASCYLDLILETEDEAKKADLRLDADVVSGYLAERFAGAKDEVMVAGGDATIRIAAKEAQYKNTERADRLYTAFFENYRRHPLAATLAMSKAGEFLAAERYDDAVKYYRIVVTAYSNTTHYAGALAQLSRCYGKLGDRKAEIGYITAYLGVETVRLRRLQAQFQLAQMYQKDGLAVLSDAATNAVPEEVEAMEKRGTAQIVRAIQNFTGFAKEADAALDDPATPEADLAKYRQLKEAALFMVGECWSRMNRPEKNLAKYRTRAVASYTAYLEAYPEGQWAKIGYVKLGTIYTALGDLAKSKDALDQLSKKYPDSDEAKNAKPRLAKSLIEMGMRKEGTEVYGEMLRTDGAYTAGQFVNAGEALIEAKSWDFANQAFEKAIRLAGTNQVVTAAKARLGLAKCQWKQGSLAEARESLDQLLGDEKMSKKGIVAEANFMLVEVASDQGRAEKDTATRKNCFGAAIGALTKVRQYWNKQKRPQWEQDQLDLMSADVLIDRMKAEEAMGLKEEALETCALAVSKLQVFFQSRGVTEEHPIEKMEPGEVANLERGYATVIPLLSKLGAPQAKRLIAFGEQYVNLFPNGKARVTIENFMNQARADLTGGKQE